MKRIFSIYIFMGLTLLAQSARSHINDGVDLYNNQKYAEAETKFIDGLNKEYETFEGHFNLGDALYKQGKLQEALKSYQNAMALAKDDKQRAQVFHNVGNTFLKDKKLKESLEAYKNSLRLNPNDNETKYNLSYALKQMQQQQNQQQQNQDQNKDQNKDQQQQDQQQQNQNKDQNQEQNKDQQQQQQPQEQKDQISKEEAQRILEALKNNESDLQKELRKRKSRVIQKEKDW